MHNIIIKKYIVVQQFVSIIIMHANCTQYNIVINKNYNVRRSYYIIVPTSRVYDNNNALRILDTGKIWSSTSQLTHCIFIQTERYRIDGGTQND